MCGVTTKYLFLLLKKCTVRCMYRLYLVFIRLMWLFQKSIFCEKLLFVK
jgi:hypothetical protein